MSVYSIRFSGELRLVSDEIWQGETPEEAAVRILGPIGVIVEDFEDVAKLIKVAAMSSQLVIV